MEMVLNNGFSEMTGDEIMNTEGGGPVAVVGLICLALLLVCGTKGCADADAGK